MKRLLAILTLVASVTLSGLGNKSNADGEIQAIRIGSKKFTESVILQELAAQLAEASGATVIRRQELGGTRILWNALKSGDIDVYPEYSGTVAREILRERRPIDDAAIESELARRDVRMSRPLGFSNRYALGMLRRTAEKLGVRSISELAGRNTLRFGLSDEFLNRVDGWPGLRTRYRLDPSEVRGIDHDLAYRGLADGSIDVIDLYTTDPEISFYSILILQDDLGYFSDNESLFLFRADFSKRAPAALNSILRLQGRIDGKAMISMNGDVKIGRQTEKEVAADFLASNFGVERRGISSSVVDRVFQRTIEHIRLTSLSLIAAIVVALPLGVIAAKWTTTGQVILATVSILQTIPSLALLVFMIPFLGIGAPPAIATLFLYSLLPIVRNTASGLTNISSSIRNSGIALGLTPAQRLRLIELPMASPLILDGVKIAAVINVGTATLGALIGAGGYGQPIFTGVRLDDFGLILEGAIPAALLALAVQLLFELFERYFVPRGLRLKPNQSI